MAAEAPRIQSAPQRLWLNVRRAAGVLVQPQVSSAARERRDMLVLLLAVAFVVAPHFDHLPWWAASLLALLWGWRLWLTLAQQPLPGRFAMLPLLLAAAAAVWVQHGTLLGREAGVTFLLLLMALKLLEMRARRDIFVVIFLSFFILLTQFLFSQALSIAVVTIGAVIALFFLLVSVNLQEHDIPAGRKVRLVGLVFLKSLPLAAAMFVLFPRVTGPLWGMPGDVPTGRTGLSHSMSPGSISRLFESREVVLRAQFDSGAPPPNEQLYWRGPVFGRFDGRTWSPLAERNGLAPLQIRAQAASVVDYTVTLEPHNQDWLFALDMPVARDEPGTLQPRVTPEGQLLSARPISERIRYPMRSFTVYALGLNENPHSLQDWMQLPEKSNPRTRKLADELRLPDPGLQQVHAVLDHFRRGGYAYTLEPPLLGRDSIDQFLFETRQGYCEHYASAFVVLMRMLDIPARVVTGYQGGEVNPVDRFLTVRQSDAHAWAEVWLPQHGWLRVDPTAVVAPVRINRGAAELARERGYTPLTIDVSDLSVLRLLRYNFEALQNAWNQWVLSYSPEKQRALLEKLGFDPDWRTLGVLFAVALASILSILAVFSLRHRVARDPLAVLFGRFRRRLEQAGVRAPPNDGPRALATRLERELTPDSMSKAREILSAFEQWRYSRYSIAVPPRAVRRLRRAIQRFRPRPA